MSKRKTDDTDPSFCIIIRAIHCRGERQALALAELDRRRLWLSDDQKLASRGCVYAVNGCAHPQFCREGCAGVVR